MSFGNTTKDFTIKKANLTGSLKPNKIEVRKVADKATGMTMAIQKEKFGNKTA